MFNSIDSCVIRVFNKECDKSVWDTSVKPDFINFELTTFISEINMTDEEKEKNPTYKTVDGYLKVFTYKEAWRNAYDNATKEDIELLTALPNFDTDVFFDISGIRIE